MRETLMNILRCPDVPQAQEKFYGGLAEHTKLAFWGKSLFTENDIRRALIILDAGCGNGRFTNEAAKSGAELIGLDLGWGVNSAFEHTRKANNIQIVRGDLFRLPFSDKTFDRVFSIGVPMHTGNAKQAFNSIARTVNLRGLLLGLCMGKANSNMKFWMPSFGWLPRVCPLSCR